MRGDYPGLPGGPNLISRVLQKGGERQKPGSDTGLKTEERVDAQTGLSPPLLTVKLEDGVMN